jgi:hypothetical protein
VPVACTPLNKESILSEYKDVLEGIELFPGECDIRIDENIAPAINHLRRISFALREKLQTELERMGKCEVITTVTEPTEWVNSLAMTEKKPGSRKLRVCLDPCNLNNAYLGLITP